MRASSVAFFAAWAAWIAYALYYIFSPAPPHSLAGDLGYSVVGIGRIAAQATSWHNVTDMVGWATWNDFPSFLYAPMGQYVLAVPIDMLFGDPIRTVKLEQVVTITLAFLGAARLFASLYGRDRWRWLAAFIYAAMPLSANLVQWDGDFAWVVALAPWAPAIALDLGRRFGAAALPAAGVLCGLATFAFAPEQGVTLGLPLLVLTLAFYRRERIRLPILGVVAAFAAWLLLPAFVVLQTRYGAHPMWWTPGTLSEFDRDSSGLRSLFANGPLELIAGVYREALGPSDGPLNVSAALAFALAAGAAALLLSAYAFAVSGVRSALLRWWPVVVVAAVGALLACGTRVPWIGGLLWNDLILHVPLLNALRTPDRFMQIAALLVALAATYGARRGFSAGGSTRVRVVALCAIVVVGYGCYGVREGILGFGDAGQLPDFSGVNASVEGIGGRTAVYAFPLNGSPLAFAAYAPKTPTAEFVWSLMQRHVDGDGGVALLRRAAVHSIVTTPNWTQPSIDGMPADMAEPISRSRFASASFAGASGARVFRIEGAREAAVTATPVCTFAGPAGFELAAGEDFLETAALLHGARDGCPRTVLVDADPLDQAVPERAVATWVGAELFGDLGFPTPNKFEIDRMQLAAPWYRDAYQGDSLLAGYPLITANSGSSNQMYFSVSRPGRYSVYVRASGPATFQVRDEKDRAFNASSTRMVGFRWIEIPVGELAAGSRTLDLTILRFSELTAKIVIDEVAVAPSHIEPSPLHVDAAIVTRREFAPPGGIDARAPLYLFPRLVGASWSPDVRNVEVGAGTQVGMFNNEPEIRTSLPHTRIRFRWDGPDGDYLVAAAAWLAGGGSRAIVTARGQTIEARYDMTLAPQPIDGRLTLRHGDDIDVTLTTGGAGANALTQLALLPLGTAEPPTEYDESGEMWQFSANYPLAFLEALRSRHVSMIAGSLRAPAGTVEEIPFHPDLVGGPVTALLEYTGGNGRASLRCGDAVDALDIGAGTQNPGSVDLSVVRPRDVPCSLRVEWSSAEFQLKIAHIRATGSTLLGWVAPQYFADGAYRWDSSVAAGVAIAIDGSDWKAGTARHVSAGLHRLTFERAPAPLPTVRFLRESAWPLRVPNPGSIVQRSSTDWSARPAAATTLEIAELNDGNWFARGERATSPGYECDLVNTCFDVTGPQTVSIGRTLPSPLVLGLMISLADVLFAALCLVLGRRQGRPGRTG